MLLPMLLKRKEGRKEGRFKDGGGGEVNEGRKDGIRREAMFEIGRKEGRKERRKGRKEEGRKEGRFTCRYG
jgi:hypothetical protein